jgi:hypothetical protein
MEAGLAGLNDVVGVLNADRITLTVIGSDVLNGTVIDHNACLVEAGGVVGLLEQFTQGGFA